MLILKPLAVILVVLLSASVNRIGILWLDRHLHNRLPKLVAFTMLPGLVFGLAIAAISLLYQSTTRLAATQILLLSLAGFAVAAVVSAVLSLFTLDRDGHDSARTDAEQR